MSILHLCISHFEWSDVVVEVGRHNVLSPIYTHRRWSSESRRARFHPNTTSQLVMTFTSVHDVRCRTDWDQVPTGLWPISHLSSAWWVHRNTERDSERMRAKANRTADLFGLAAPNGGRKNRGVTVSKRQGTWLYFGIHQVYETSGCSVTFPSIPFQQNAVTPFPIRPLAVAFCVDTNFPRASSKVAWRRCDRRTRVEMPYSWWR